MRLLFQRQRGAVTLVELIFGTLFVCLLMALCISRYLLFIQKTEDYTRKIEAQAAISELRLHLGYTFQMVGETPEKEKVSAMLGLMRISTNHPYHLGDTEIEVTTELDKILLRVISVKGVPLVPQLLDKWDLKEEMCRYRLR